ncbi:MAG: hypothetical protein HY289_01020 [Planctomycetes bacterium]|nr:hypothetical protein [Planctomycetota bacterium]
MATVLYADFLNDPEEYTRAESFWKQRWQQLMEGVGKGESWQAPWFNTTSVNGTPIRDGQSIFSAVCPSRRLGVNVIQLDPADEDLEFRAWTDTFGDDEDAIRKLVVACTLTERSAAQAMDIIKRWITEERID